MYNDLSRDADIACGRGSEWAFGLIDLLNEGERSNMKLIHAVTMRNFRCFENDSFDLAAPTVLILGENGSGKTSLLEALFYATTLRSFKTRYPRDCIRFNSDGYLITVAGEAEAEWELRAAVDTHGNRLVKLNGSPVASWHELTAQCRAVTISEEDLLLVSGPPEERRRFLDHAISLENGSYMKQLVLLRRVVRQKNALLTSNRCNQEAYVSWTEKLEELSETIRAVRQEYIEKLHDTISRLSAEHLAARASVGMRYKMAKNGMELFARETAMRRTLAGAHLDDVEITLADRSVRQFASRGQQKVVAFLLKAGAIALLSRPALILVDDFMTDFDEKNAEALIFLAKRLGGQLILTAPQPGCLPNALSDQIELQIKLAQRNMSACKK
ncbi:MAG: DNA replication and repair protein RecF [Candidatus Dependentiae bacterium]|nr:DNA replication and repair protein RecF [Candidatus Dependentiae bacterium]